MRFGRTETRREFWLTVFSAATLLIVVAPLIAMRLHKTSDRVATPCRASSPRARLQFVAGRLTRYAREYHRPAYRFDSVIVREESGRRRDRHYIYR
jgi:hypothetical protein